MIRTLLVCGFGAVIGVSLTLLIRSEIRVQAQTGKIYVTEVHVDAKGADIPGSQIVGFSCIPHGTTIRADCYVASR